MVQTRRARRGATAPLLRLPAEILRKIASTSVSPGLVVAAGRNVEARTATRKGTDEAERSRFGGIGVTIKEAEYILRTRYREYTDERWLASRAAAGRALCRETLVRSHEDHPDAPDCDEDWRWDSHGTAVFFASGWLSMMIAYGAPVPVWRETRPTGLFIHTPLHLLALYAPPDAVDVAQLLIAAGNDINAQMFPPQDTLGPTPLCWCLTAQQEDDGPTDSHFELARFLIEQGCDVLLAHRGYVRAIGYYPWMAEENLPNTLLGLLAEYPQRPESQSFAAYFREKLEALGVNLDADSDSGDDSSSESDESGYVAPPLMY